jgi:DNA-binding beta-propeller fold protein YncE
VTRLRPAGSLWRRGLRFKDESAAVTHRRRDSAPPPRFLVDRERSGSLASNRQPVTPALAAPDPTADARTSPMGRTAHRILLVALLTLAAATARAAIGDLYVTSDASDIVREYQGATGAFQVNFTTSVGGDGQLAIHFGATNNRVLVGHFSGGVDEFDATTGAYIKTYNPTGGTQWAGIYMPNGSVWIGDWATHDVREYDAVTGAFVAVRTSIPGPSDMRIGPNGNLYICSYTDSLVMEVNPATGAFIQQWSLPFGARANDIAFNPANGHILVTAMGTNVAHVFDAFLNPLGVFAGTLWQRPHGIELHPVTGHVLAVDGVTGQVHEFDPLTYVELNPAYLVPTPGDKIVDLAFRPPGAATPAGATSWGRIKRLYR